MVESKWQEMKTEYITTDASYQNLADKFGIAKGSLAKRASAEKWVELKKQYNNKIFTKTVNKISSKEANKLSTLVKSADNMCAVIANTLKDKDQFNKYLVNEKDGDVITTKEKVFSKIDTKAIRDMTTAIKDMTAVIRNLNNLPTQAEAQAQSIAAERLELERKKANADDVDKTITVKFEGDLDDYAQ